jgi:hypothetical protein
MWKSENSNLINILCKKLCCSCKSTITFISKEILSCK